jgi:hypothetical protein
MHHIWISGQRINDVRASDVAPPKLDAPYPYICHDRVTQSMTMFNLCLIHSLMLKDIGNVDINYLQAAKSHLPISKHLIMVTQRQNRQDGSEL